MQFTPLKQGNNDAQSQPSIYNTRDQWELEVNTHNNALELVSSGFGLASNDSNIWLHYVEWAFRIRQSQVVLKQVRSSCRLLSRFNWNRSINRSVCEKEYLIFVLIPTRSVNQWQGSVSRLEKVVFTVVYQFLIQGSGFL